MLRLFAVAAGLAVLFASTFIVAKSAGLVTVDSIRTLLIWASDVNVIYLGIAVTLLLFADMFIAIPTLTVVTLSGYFMGPVLGSLFSVFGMWVAGLSGYYVSWQWGDSLLIKIYKDEEKLIEMKDIFSEYGVYVLMLCRAAPILPEVTCCLSGANKVSFKKFFTFYSIGTIPYAILASYAGSRSTLDDPLPGVIAALAISITLWAFWFILIRFHYRSKLVTLND